MAYDIFCSSIFESNVFEIEYYYRTKEDDSRTEKILRNIIDTIQRIQDNPEGFPLKPKY